MVPRFGVPTMISWRTASAPGSSGSIGPWSPRADLLGLFWYGCLLGFLAWGRSRLLYVGAFVVVTYLELIGTRVGTWEWQPYDPTGLVTMGNPPSGAAGGYGWFDLAAITLAPLLLGWWQRLSSRRGEGAENRGVQQAVRGDRVPADHG